MVSFLSARPMPSNPNQSLTNLSEPEIIAKKLARLEYGLRLITFELSPFFHFSGDMMLFPSSALKNPYLRLDALKENVGDFTTNKYLDLQFREGITDEELVQLLIGKTVELKNKEELQLVREELIQTITALESLANK
ncbi:hypothetical protein O9G_002804 [Rozella allomycis CSF55]|uniref:Uncharacterized protein n=1 Tax=Rozella allomycis (strain CSF55) TaxID=988480 RepID=A0A075AQQ8_ROZAC|nr:hypothetical protein O9G_002804 [Rozella allomycis CSF55]|eukprot:EPZ30927.1 hypothetical protein O9G_002804 [Rozella allomycis CSF55]